MAVARQFHADEPGEARFGQRHEAGGHVHVAVPERQVNVLAALHVLEADRADGPGELADGRGGLAFAGHQQVAQVQREAEPRDVAGQRRVIVHGFHDHARLGFQRGPDAARCGVGRHRRDPVAQPRRRVAAVDVRLGDATPERYRFGAQDRADVDSPLEEVDPAGAPFRPPPARREARFRARRAGLTSVTR